MRRCPTVVSNTSPLVNLADLERVVAGQIQRYSPVEFLIQFICVKHCGGINYDNKYDYMKKEYNRSYVNLKKFLRKKGPEKCLPQGLYSARDSSTSIAIAEKRFGCFKSVLRSNLCRPVDHFL